MKRFLCTICWLAGMVLAQAQQPGAFPIVANKQAATIYIDPHDAKVVSIAATAFQEDIFDITQQRPAIDTGTTITGPVAIIAGTIGQSALIDQLASHKKINTKAITGKWETFCIQIVAKPFKNVAKAMVIYGSDRRGTAFGIFECSRLLGVSPFKWWADVVPEPRTDLYLPAGTKVVGPPSVKYRGIFINDEDWGLQPWAARHMDTAIKDIGPNTYAKVFELMLRLKANYIWPAMHPCTKAFYYYKDNPKVADDYAIVVGGSHCEPMLRNNVFEWSENFSKEYGKAPGEWRYDHNKNEIYTYWQDRIQEAKTRENVYTIGMRGVHDGSMPGPKPIDEKVTLLQQIITDQRHILDSTLQKPITTIPQIFCPYKEVLNVYRRGLQLPDDVTIVWSDDNHGYIRQLSNAQEQKRSGASGIYYHLSYWGSPADYLWLSSISPALISYEMTKAYDYGANRLWVFNVGDIKPAELEIQFAMDLAWDVHRWPPNKTTDYIHQWAEQTFGAAYADTITAIKQQYYTLAAAGKPEHLDQLSFDSVAGKLRVSQYASNLIAANRMGNNIDSITPRLNKAYYQLIYYPVMGAAKMNTDYYQASYIRSGFVCNPWTIEKETDQYNQGKWSGIMSSHPRDRDVFKRPIETSKFISHSMTRPAIIIAAANYNNKKEYGNKHIDTITALGFNGRGVTVLPFTQVPTADSQLTNTNYVEYKVQLAAGTHALTVKCLPTQSIDNDEKLYYAISVNNDAPTWVNIHAESESAFWKKNVLRGYAEGKSTHRVSTAGESVIRVYFPDEGVVINTIEID